MVVKVCGSGWWVGGILVFRLSLDQAEQYPSISHISLYLVISSYYFYAKFQIEKDPC